MKKQKTKRNVLFLNIEDADEEHVALIRRTAGTLGIKEIVASSDGRVDNVPVPDVYSWLDMLKGLDICDLADGIRATIWRVVYNGPDYSDDPEWYGRNLLEELMSPRPCKLWPELEPIRYMMRRYVCDHFAHRGDEAWVRSRLEPLISRCLLFFYDGQIEDKIHHGPPVKPCAVSPQMSCSVGQALNAVAK